MWNSTLIHTQKLDNVCSCVVLLKGKVELWASLHPAPEKSKSNFTWKCYSPEKTVLQVPKLYSDLTPGFLFIIWPAANHFFFLCLRFLTCKMEKIYINNNINNNNNGNVVLVCKALWDPWLKGTMGVPSIIIWPRDLFKLSVPKGQERLGSFVLEMSCKYHN